MSEPAPKKIIVKKKGTYATVPSKRDKDEEIKRISDLLLTLHKRVKQLADRPEPIEN